VLAVRDDELGMGGDVLSGGGGCRMGREHVSDRWKQEKLLGTGMLRNPSGIRGGSQLDGPVTPPG